MRHYPPFNNLSVTVTGVAQESTLQDIYTRQADGTQHTLVDNFPATYPITAAALPLPAGAATQATLANLLTELQLKADLTDTQPVSVVSLPLPANAATETTLGQIKSLLQIQKDFEETIWIDNGGAGNLFFRIRTFDQSTGTSTITYETVTGSPYVPVGSTAAASSFKDIEFVRTQYRANSAGTGYSIGNIVLQTTVYDTSTTTPTVRATLWYNESTLTSISAPSVGHLDPFEGVISHKTASAAMSDGISNTMNTPVDNAGNPIQYETVPFSFNPRTGNYDRFRQEGEAPTPSRTPSFSGAKATVVAVPAKLYGWNFICPATNLGGVYVKFYDALLAGVTVGTTVPVLTLQVPAGGSVVWMSDRQEFMSFTTGIVIACVTGMADSSTTTPLTSIHVQTFYK